jgi:transcriptional regulator with XRE-family HTH domain
MTHLSSYRAKNGLSQRAFAQLASLSPSYLCEIEKGEKIPSLKAARRIQEATNGEVTLEDLFSDGG